MSAPINGCNFDFGNEPGKYTLIYADPPWQYRDKAKDGERGVDFKYSTMNLQDIKRLPVWDLAAESCLLAMWHVGPMPREALDVMEAWGFRLFNMKGFTWHKIHAKSGKDCMGMGHLTRSNTEDCLFAIKGKLPERMMANIIQHVSAEEHVTAAPKNTSRQRGANTQPSLRFSLTNWCSCWVMYRGLNCSPGRRKKAGTTGVISVSATYS